MSLTIGELGDGGWRHSCRQLLLRTEQEKKTQLRAGFAGESAPRVARSRGVRDGARATQTSVRWHEHKCSVTAQTE